MDNLKDVIENSASNTKSVVENSASNTQSVVENSASNTKSVVENSASNTKSVVENSASNTQSVVENSASNTQSVIENSASNTQSVVENSASNTQSVVENSASNTQSVVENSASNTQSVVENSASNTQSVVEEVKVLVTPKKINIDTDVRQEDIDSATNFLQSYVDLPSGSELKIEGAAQFLIGQSGNNQKILVGNGKNIFGADIQFQDDTLYYTASVSKFIGSALVYRLIQKGYLSLTDTVGKYIDSWKLHNKKLKLLKNLTVNNNVSEPGTWVDGKVAGSRVQLLDENDIPQWTTQGELDIIKDQLVSIDREITVQDFMYHTSGFAGDITAVNFANLQLISGASIISAVSSFDMIYNYPDQIGCSARQPGTAFLYDVGNVMFAGVLEIIYNFNKNKIPVTQDMPTQPGYMFFEEIMYEELAKEIDCDRDDYIMQQQPIFELDGVTPTKNALRTAVLLTGEYTTLLVQSPTTALSQITTYFTTEYRHETPAQIQVRVLTAKWFYVGPAASAGVIVLPPHSPVNFGGQFSSAPKQISDYSGRIGAFTSKMLINCTTLFLNKGMFGDKRILSKTLLNIATLPIHPPSLIKTELDGSGAPLNIAEEYDFSFGLLGVNINLGTWLKGGVSPLVSGWKTVGDLGANGSVIEFIGESCASITTVNNIFLYISFTDVDNGGLGVPASVNRFKMWTIGYDTRFILTQNLDIDEEFNSDRMFYMAQPTTNIKPPGV